MGMTAFLRDTRGGAMLVGGGLVIGLLATVGSLMANYAWREAQLAEIDGAMRATASASANLLGGAPAAIADRFEDVVTAMVDGLEIDSVTVSYDQATGITEVAVAGRVSHEGIFGQAGGVSNLDRTIRLRFETDRYEVAVALDVSPSMRTRFGNVGNRLDGLKAAMGVVTTVIRGANAATPGSIMVSVVPFASTVNVAHTGGSGRTAAKERYVRMLAGPAATTADLLAQARRQKSSGKGGHWVDTFHQYGVGGDMGPLLRQFLPQDLLDGRDWNLRRRDVDVDVTAQVPSLGTWTVDDIDFWNGCVMARWGAYWNEDARGPGWRQDDAGNWPARSTAPAWSPGGNALPGLPLHLSDVPPSAADPNTLFTAYSWPDARIGGTAAARLQTVMMEVLDGVGRAYDAGFVSDNDWSRAVGGAGGDELCVPTPITPLTGDVSQFEGTVNGLQAPDVGVGDVGMTYTNLGVVWGLRTLSPLWAPVWKVRDARNVPRPLVPCAPGESQNCHSWLRKMIVIVSDGENSSHGAVRGPVRYGGTRTSLNPNYADNYLCHATHTRRRPTYHSLWQHDTETAFNLGFGYRVYSGGTYSERLTPAGAREVADALMRFPNTLPGGQPRRAKLIRRLQNLVTPWDLFRGQEAWLSDYLVLPDLLGDPEYSFEFEGRPIHPDRHFCSLQSPFGPFGRADDSVQVGGVPVSGVAPFADLNTVQPTPALYRRAMDGRLIDWLVDACKIAGDRGIRIEAIFIGDRRRRQPISELESCLDAAGGDPNLDEVFVTPNANALTQAFTDIFTVRRSLRILN